MAITLITLGTFFNYKNNGGDVSQYGWLPLASFVVFIVGFAVGFGPIPWLMMGEILPGNYRTIIIYYYFLTNQAVLLMINRILQ